MSYIPNSMTFPGPTYLTSGIYEIAQLAFGILQKIHTGTTYINNLSVFATEQFAEGRYDAAVDERGDLFLGAADAEV